MNIMDPAELEKIIDRAILDRVDKLVLQECGLSILPTSIGNLAELKLLDLYKNNLKVIPESIGNLAKLTNLNLNHNQIATLPERIGQLTNLTSLVLSDNQLTSLPANIGNLSNLARLYIRGNLLTSFPSSMGNLSNLREIYIDDNPWIDLSNLQDIPNLRRVYFLGINLPRKYWTHLDRWKSHYFLNEDNVDLRRMLIDRIGLPQIIEQLTTFIPDLSKIYNPIYRNKIVLNLRSRKLSVLPESICQLTYITDLELTDNLLINLPDNIGNISKLTHLNLIGNQLKTLPSSIGDLHRLTDLNLHYNQLVCLPNQIVNLSSLTHLNLSHNRLKHLPKHIGNLSNLTDLNLSGNKLKSLPRRIDRLSKLTNLNLSGNRLNCLPQNLANLSSLIDLNLNNNPWTDLSELANIPNLKWVRCFDVMLDRRYWTKLNEWKPEWLLDEKNAEIRRIIIEQVGYEKICDELNPTILDTWREYSLLKIEGVKEEIYDGEDEPVDSEPMILLKMTCPSTAHIHILRVPPEMVSAETAITWVNHGIHPDRFATQT
jgi:leucine-rich repeat protein SHOC2